MSTTSTVTRHNTTTTSPSNPQSTTPLLASLQRDGYVHIPKLLTPQQLSSLRDASVHITSQTRSGKWPFFRTVPKQFPPWPKDHPPTPSEGGIWGVQHLLHPDIPFRSTFASLYFSNEVLSPVKDLLGIPPSAESDTDLVMELFNLLVSPTNTDFELVWHRDDVKPDLSPEEELSQLQAKSPNGRQAHAQYNVALYDDDSLIVIPGSHRRARTPTERNASPHETGLPNETVVRMSPGDAVFYDSNIVHRGVYKGISESEIGRMTLHGSVGLAGHGLERARQVLQHGVGEWIGRDDAGFEGIGEEEMVKRAEIMRAKLREMGNGEHVGYSLEG